MEKFKIGDKVRVHKPVVVDRNPIWVSHMDKYDGMEGEVVEVFDSESIKVCIGLEQFQFNTDWCTLAPTAVEELNQTRTIEAANKIRAYIAGKISGLDGVTVATKFGEAADKLRGWGFEPISPLDYCEDGTPWVDCMLTLLPVLKTCQGIYLLDNWSDSDGAKVEKLFAEKMGLFLINGL